MKATAANEHLKPETAGGGALMFDTASLMMVLPELILTAGGLILLMVAAYGVTASRAPGQLALGRDAGRSRAGALPGMGDPAASRRSMACIAPTRSAPSPRC
jgi:hypothetical protein